MEPEELTVIVIGAKELNSKKKGKGKFSVIFGVGNNKFRTDSVREPTGNPEWKQESTITVSNCLSPLTLVVTDREDVLGQVTVQLNEIQHTKGLHSYSAVLRPHRKCSNPQGELSFEAWISKSHEKPLLNGNSILGTSPPVKSGTFMKFKGRLLSTDPVMKLRDVRKGSLSNLHAAFGRKKSVSKLEHEEAGRMYRAMSTVAIGSHRLDDESRHRAQSCFDLEKIALEPQITGLSPNEGPCEGATRLTIRGVNLGVDKADVVGLFVAGSNVLASVEYESSTKLICTTKSWRPCSGPVVVKTQSGGRGYSLVDFNFCNAAKPVVPESVVVVGDVITCSCSDDTPPILPTGCDENENDYDGRLDTSTEDVHAEIERQLSSSPISEKRHKKRNSMLSWNKDKTGSLTKAEMVEALEKSRAESAILLTENLALKLKNRDLLSQNKELRDQSKNLKTYINQLLERVINQCPDVLKVSNT